VYVCQLILQLTRRHAVAEVSLQSVLMASAWIREANRRAAAPSHGLHGRAASAYSNVKQDIFRRLLAIHAEPAGSPERTAFRSPGKAPGKA